MDYEVWLHFLTDPTFAPTVAKATTKRTQLVIHAIVAIVPAVCEHILKKVKAVALILNSAKYTPSTAKTAKEISTDQTATRIIKNRKAKRKQVCQKFRKCLICCKQYTVHPKKPHKCYHGTCRNCNNFVNIYEHHCLIQPVEPLAKRLVDDEDGGNDDENKPPTLTVIGDIQFWLKMMLKARKF